MWKPSALLSSVVVHPVLYHGRHRREVKTTEDKSAEGFHIHDLTVAFDINGTDYVLDLQLNRNLIPSNYFQKYHHKVSHWYIIMKFYLI
jgi:hypothetical protein